MKTQILCAMGMIVVIAGNAQAQSRQQRIKEHFQGRPHADRHDGPRRTDNPITIMRFRSIDGSFNNLVKTAWGTAGNNLKRLTAADYQDGRSAMAGADRLSPRAISNFVLAQDKDTPNQRKLTSMVWQWGQFLDHDLDLTHAAQPPEQAPIDVPRGDPFFDPFELGNQFIDFYRSEYNSKSGISSVRQQTNSITAWIDGSNIYGSDEETLHLLRQFAGGRLKVSDGKLLPIDDDGFFLAGDIRANEQLALTSMHTLWVREHNRTASLIRREKPHLSDEQLFLRARRRVIALLQSITFNEFLPALLGQDALSPYQGYKPWISPKINNEFSTAAYRFGHSMLNEELLRLNNSGQTIADGNLPLRDAFFNPQALLQHGIDPYLKGLVSQQAQEIDAQIVDDVRNFLFGTPGSGGFDLAALNIQRGRDHGLNDFNSIRESIGLPRLDRFDQITTDQQVQVALEVAYGGDINDLDAWVGMLAEDHAPGASVGPTAHRILKLQFEALRDADRFWYQNNLSPAEIADIERIKMVNIIVRNSGVRRIPGNVFFMSQHRP